MVRATRAEGKAGTQPGLGREGARLTSREGRRPARGQPRADFVGRRPQSL